MLILISTQSKSFEAKKEKKKHNQGVLQVTSQVISIIIHFE